VSAWAGTTPPKKWENCRKGRGFGTGAERLGALKENAPQVEPPTCPVCKTPDGRPLPLLFREGKNGRESFYGCKNYSDHPNVKAIVNAAEWVAKQGSAKPANGGGDAAASK
jgi:ssDNA-binding Zn-finger/Zn-ribbon topoisomerase 1